jgi:hypothetical protein
MGVDGAKYSFPPNSRRASGGPTPRIARASMRCTHCGAKGLCTVIARAQPPPRGDGQISAFLLHRRGCERVAGLSR